MGRGQPAVRTLIDGPSGEMDQYRRTLYERRQESFDQLLDDAPAIKAAGPADVDRGMLFATCRAQQQEINELQARLAELEGD